MSGGLQSTTNIHDHIHDTIQIGFCLCWIAQSPVYLTRILPGGKGGCWWRLALLGWLLALLVGVTSLATLLPFLALPLGGIIEVDEEEHERKYTS